MKIKPFLAVTAFAASMSAFAQSAPTQPRTNERAPAGGPTTAASTERAALRRDIDDFSRIRARDPKDGVDAQDHAATVHTADRGAKLHVDEEHQRRRAKRETWAERRVEVEEAKAARRLKRQERQKEVHGPAAHHPAVSQS